MSATYSRFVYNIPSKTFLTGEYAVLHGAPAVVLAHRPCFQLILTAGGDGSCQGIHPKSPGGQWLRRQPEAFSKMTTQFVDPYQGSGGFGASSAQFAAIYAWSQMPDRGWREFQLNAAELWKTYRRMDHGGEQAPSGADVVAQCLGGATVFSSAPWRAESRAWPFEDLAVLLVPTGHKVATHEHLRERLPVSDLLMTIARLAADSFWAGNTKEFLRALLGYGEELERLQLVTPAARGLLAQVLGHSGVLAAKGCGALGADVLAVLCEPQALASVQDWLKALGLKAVATSNDLSPGLSVEVQLAPRLELPEGESWA